MMHHLPAGQAAHQPLRRADPKTAFAVFEKRPHTQRAVHRQLQAQINRTKRNAAVACLLKLQHSIVSSDENLSGFVLIKDVDDVSRSRADRETCKESFGFAGALVSSRQMFARIPIEVSRKVETADTAIGRRPVNPVTGFQQINDGCARKSLFRAVGDEAITVKAAQPLHRAEPEKATRIADDAANAIVCQPVSGRVNLNG